MTEIHRSGGHDMMNLQPTMNQKVPITVAHGDGIGPEIMQASLHIIQEAGAALEIETIDVGEQIYLSGNTAGMEPSAWESLRRTKVFYKAPITTPQGGGYKSLNDGKQGFTLAQGQ